MHAQRASPGLAYRTCRISQIIYTFLQQTHLYTHLQNDTSKEQNYDNERI